MAASSIQAGDYRHRITIQAPVSTKNPVTGGWTSMPTTIATRIPAFVEPLRGAELTRAYQIDPRSRYAVHLRYPYQQLSGRMVVIYHSREGDKRLEILAVNNIDEGNRQVDLTCGEAS